MNGRKKNWVRRGKGIEKVIIYSIFNRNYILFFIGKRIGSFKI